MFRIPHPLFNEAGAVPTDTSGGFPADDFSSALEQGVSSYQAELNGQSPQEQVSQPSDDLGGKESRSENKPEPTGKDRLAGKLGKVAEEEAEQQESSEEELPPEGDSNPKGVSRWKQLRQTEKQFKELEPKLKEYEKQIAELKKAQVPPELEAELNELRQHRDVFDLRNSPEYKKTVSEPLNRIEAEVGEISKEFNLNDDALLNAMRDPVEWRRTIAIEKVIKAAEKAGRDAAEEAGEEYAGIPSGVVNVIANHANRVHQVWSKRDELESKAADLRQSKEAEQSKKSQLSTAEQEKAWQQASDESLAIIEANLAPLFKGMPEDKKATLFDAMKSARISDDPVTRAFQAHAPEVLAAMTDAINDLKKENAMLKKTQNGLVAARPGTKMNHGEPAKKVPLGSDFDDFDAELAAGMRNQFA